VLNSAAKIKKSTAESMPTSQSKMIYAPRREYEKSLLV